MPLSREADRRALVKLLADDDTTVLHLLEERFAAMGAEGLGFLESILQGPAEESRRGARWILQALRLRDAAEVFSRFCATCNEPSDLETGCWLLAKTQYPDLDETAYRARLDELAVELRARLTGGETPRSTIEVINRHLFYTLGFRGNKRDYYDPDNSYLNRVLDRRLGIPISLSVLYLLLGRRLKLPLTSVNLPGHFVLRWQARLGFFIDPFNEGRVLTEADCREYCEQIGLKFGPQSLSEASTRQVMVRLCNNLQAIYAESDPPRAQQFDSYIALLSRT